MKENFNLLDKYLKNVLTKLAGLDEGQQRIEQGLTRIEKKVDEIHKYVVDLANNINELKNISRDDDDKIFLISQQIDRFESFVTASGSEDMKDYRELSKKLFVNWDELDDLTREFIPVAEYLYTQLQLQPEMDFSPVVIEYCRAIENEFLLKVFKKYTIELIKLKGNSIHSFLFKDQENAYTKVFAGKIKRAIRSMKPEYTLGEMNTILSLVTQTDKLENSELLYDFRHYLDKEFNTSKLLDYKYIEKISNIVRQYRNPSAHPNFLTLEDASKCKKSIPENIDQLIECRAI